MRWLLGRFRRSGRPIGFAARSAGRCVKVLPSPGCALHLDAAAVRLDDVLHDREPEAAALDVVHQAAADAVELLEDLLLLARRDADAVVAHRDAHLVAARRAPSRRSPVCRSST